MNANPTAGIILLLGAAVLIVLGVTTKGKRIIAILTGKDTGSGVESVIPPGSKQESGGVSGDDIKNPGVWWATYPGTHAGEKPAGVVNL